MCTICCCCFFLVCMRAVESVSSTKFTYIFICLFLDIRSLLFLFVYCSNVISFTLRLNLLITNYKKVLKLVLTGYRWCIEDSIWQKSKYIVFFFSFKANTFKYKDNIFEKIFALRTKVDIFEKAMKWNIDTYIYKKYYQFICNVYSSSI